MNGPGFPTISSWAVQPDLFVVAVFFFSGVTCVLRDMRSLRGHFCRWPTGEEFPKLRVRSVHLCRVFHHIFARALYRLIKSQDTVTNLSFSFAPLPTRGSDI